MKRISIPFDMSYDVGDDLREHLNNVDEAKKGITFLKNELKAEQNLEKKAHLNSLLGVPLRRVHSYEESEMHLLEALEYFKEKKMLKEAIVAKIRLAHTYHWMGKYSKADEIYSRLIKIIRKEEKEEVKDLEDFVLMNLGRSKFDQKHFQGAQEYFVKSLEKRTIKGSIELITEAQKAISLVQDKIQRGSKSPKKT